MRHFTEIADKNKESIDSVYDFCALCYEYLDKYAGDFELFAGEYLTTSEENENTNPNLGRLLEFQTDICLFIKSALEEGQSFGELVKRIAEKTKEVADGLTLYGNPEKNRLTPVYYLLLAIDRYLGIRKGITRIAAPMNKKYVNKVYIYFKSEIDIMQEARAELRYGLYIQKRDINTDLQHMTIVSRDLFPKGREPLKMMPLGVGNGGAWNRENKLRVAIIPFNGFGITDFKYQAGTLFEVGYTDEYNKLYLRRAIILLERAIEQKANIVLFPEYVCSPEIQEGIQNYLQKKYRKVPKKLEELLFVVAGTGWDQGDNILKVYDKTGDEVGECYKFTRFHKEKYMENLHNPGKRSVIIYVEGIGMFMPVVCRDISDGKEIEALVRAFKPFCMLVPAWSSSLVRGFEEQLKALVAETYGCAVLCNSCEPVILQGSAKQKCGLFAVSHKGAKSKIEGKCKYLFREKGCDKGCREEGCIFLLDLDFSADKVGKNQVLQDNRKQIKCEIKI